MRIAEDYYPKVINNMTVGGAQQVLLHVKVMEVRAPSCATLGFDLANLSSDGDVRRSRSVSGLLRGRCHALADRDHQRRRDVRRSASSTAATLLRHA